MMLTSKDHEDGFYLASAGLAVEELLPHVCVCALYLSEVIKAVEWRELRLLGIGARIIKRGANYVTPGAQGRFRGTAVFSDSC